MKTLKHKLNQKGFMSIEAIMAMSVVLMVIVLGISIFTYMIPRQAIEEDVHLLGRIAKMEGTLTEAHMLEFKENMVSRGLAKDTNEVTVELYKESTAGECGVLLASGEVVERGSKMSDINCSGSYAVLKVVAVVPAKSNAVSASLAFFGVNSNPLANDYVFEERVMPERYIGSGA